MNNSFLCFTLATSGLPDSLSFNKYYPPNERNHYDNARIIEIGYIIHSSIGLKQKEIGSLVMIKDFEITNTQYHGITTEMVKEYGRPIEDLMLALNRDLDDIDIIVCHNASFHYNILLSECYRINNIELIEKLNSKKLVCIMEKGKEYTNEVKYPKLAELYEYIHGDKLLKESRGVLTTALATAEYISKCYMKMV